MTRRLLLLIATRRVRVRQQTAGTRITQISQVFFKLLMLFFDHRIIAWG
jgi:hypothetical protein